MSDSIIFLIIGLLSGIILTIILLFLGSPRLLLLENGSRFNFKESLEHFEESVLSAGWKIPGKHDMRESMKKFGKRDIRDVMVYEICNPDLAEKILLTDDERVVSTMMPCRVAIYEKANGKVFYSRMNSGLFSKAMGKVTRTQMKVAFNDTEKILKSISDKD